MDTVSQQNRIRLHLFRVIKRDEIFSVILRIETDFIFKMIQIALQQFKTELSSLIKMEKKKCGNIFSII